MKVENRPNTQAFSGYLDVSVYDSINKATRKMAQKELEAANLFAWPVRKNLLQINKQKMELIKGLENSMAPFHPDTRLTMDEFGTYIMNSKTKTRISFVSSEKYNKGKLISNNLLLGDDIFDPEFVSKNISGTDYFKRMNMFVNFMQKDVNSQNVDKSLFAQMLRNINLKAAKITSPIKRIFYMKKVDSAIKMAPEFNSSGDGLRFALKRRFVDAKKHKLNEIQNANQRRENSKLFGKLFG